MFKFKEQERPLINLYRTDYSPEDWKEVLEELQIENEDELIESVSVIIRAIKQITYK